MSPDNVDQIVDQAIKYMEEGITQKKNSVRVSALLLELKDRKDKIVPEQLIYNYLAVLYVARGFGIAVGAHACYNIIVLAM